MAEANTNKSLMKYSPGQIDQMYQKGQIPREQVDLYTARKQLKHHGLMGMDPYSVDVAYRAGLLDNDQVDAYVDRQESPVSYYLKDVGKGVIGGFEKGAIETFEAIGEISQWMNPQTGMIKMAESAGLLSDEQVGAMTVDPEELTESVPDFMEKHANAIYEANKDITSTYSLPGDITKTFSQFLVPFSRVSKVTKGGQIASKILSSGIMKNMATKLPRTAKFMARLGEDTIKGAIADYAAFDPYAPKLADAISEFDPDTQNVIIDFMKTDPNNPAAVERLKQTLEGAVTGVAFDTLISGFKLAKGQLWRAVGGKKSQVVKEFDKKVSSKLEHADTDPLRRPEEPRKGHIGRRTETNAEPEKSVGQQEAEAAVREADEAVLKKPVEERRVTPKATEEDLTQTAIKIARHRHAEDLPDDLGYNKVIDAMEVEDSVQRMAKIFRSDRLDDMFEMRSADAGRHVSRETTEKQAGQRLAHNLGRGTDETMDSMRRLFKDVKNLPARVRSLNKFFVTYADAIGKMVSEPANMSFKDELRVLEHMKQLQELESIVFGVRSEIGRTLDIYNQPWTKFKGRFDLDSMDDMDLQDLANNSRQRVQRAIESFRQAKTTPAKFHVARSIGKNSYLEGVLELVQANLLWNPATHITNMLGNSVAMTNNTIKRFVGLKIHSAMTGNKEVMKEASAYVHGMRMGLIDAMRLPGVTKKNFYNPKVIMGGMKKAWEMDDEAGRVWKALFTGELQIDSGAKAEGQVGNVYEKLDKWTIRQLDRLNMNKIGVRLPLRTLIKMPFLPFHGLTAGDEFMKNIGYFSELHAQAAREGIDRNLSGKDLEDFIQFMTNKPSRNLHYKAMGNAREVTFTDDLGKASGALNEALNANALGQTVKILGVPFYKVVVNLTKYAGRQTPLAALVEGRVKNQLRNGGRDR
jgi:hypothetical protein